MWPRVCELEREKSKCVTECGHKKMHALQLCTELFYESKFSVQTLEGILKKPKRESEPGLKSSGGSKDFSQVGSSAGSTTKARPRHRL